MTNEEKAKKFFHEFKDATLCGAPLSRGSVAFQASLKMAQWKDEQYKEEKKELIGLVNMLPVDSHNQTIIEDLIALLL